MIRMGYDHVQEVTSDVIEYIAAMLAMCLENGFNPAIEDIIDTLNDDEEFSEKFPECVPVTDEMVTQWLTTIMLNNIGGR